MPIHAKIGTDMGYMMIDAKTAARVGLAHDMRGTKDEGHAAGWRDKLHKVSSVSADMAIGDYRNKVATVRIFDMNLSDEVTVLSTDFLRVNRIFIAMREQKLYITPLQERMFEQ